MARTPSNDPGIPCSEIPETLAEIVFRAPTIEQRREIEEYRIEYEAAHGPTDLTRRYTSTLPKEHQDWLVKHDPKRWFDGLPPFAKGYLSGKLEMAARDGKLDDMPDSLLALYVSKQLRLDHEVRHR